MQSDQHDHDDRSILLSRKLKLIDPNSKINSEQELQFGVGSPREEVERIQRERKTNEKKQISVKHDQVIYDYYQFGSQQNFAQQPTTTTCRIELPIITKQNNNSANCEGPSVS